MDHRHPTGRPTEKTTRGSRRIGRAPLAALLAALALAGLAWAAQPALAANQRIEMTAPVRIQVGESAVIRLSGVVAPPAEWWDSSWIEVVALPGNLMPNCPGDAGSAGSIAEESGNILAIALRPNTDEAGNFSNSVSASGRAPGQVLICGYLYNDVGTTQSGAEMRIDIVAPSSGGGNPSGGGQGSGGSGAPVNLRKPWVTYTGRRLVCHRGAWSNAHSFSYSWYLDGSLRRTRSRRPYAPIDALSGHRASCRVTARSRAGATSAMSPTIRLH